MNIIVTGGAGFIGTNFICYLLEQHPDDRIVCVDKLTYAANRSELTSLISKPNFQFYHMDICERQDIYRLFSQEQPDIIVNFAAESHVDRSITSPEVFLDTNIKGTSILMDACLKFGIKRFHQVSTDEVYGDLPLNRPDLRFTEKNPLQTSSPYSASKAAADLLAQSYHRTYGLPITISRCSNNYGPYQFPEKLIPLMILTALQNQPLPVYGTGKNIRDWLYVTDHCRAIDLILQKGIPGDVYNIGGSCELSNLELVTMICSFLNKPESLITFVEDRKGHDLRYAIDPSKIERELDWHPKINFETGLQQTIAWYVDRYRSLH